MAVATDHRRQPVNHSDAILAFVIQLVSIIDQLFSSPESMQGRVTSRVTSHAVTRFTSRV